MPIQYFPEEYDDCNKECQRNADVTSRDLNYIREWINKQPHLPQEFDDKWLERFLYGCKFSLEVFKKKLDKYYSVKSIIPEFFENVDPTSQQIKDTLNTIAVFELPRKTPDGYSVLFMKLLKPNVDEFDFAGVMKYTTMIGSVSLHSHCSHGRVIIFDTEGFTFQHQLKMIPLLKKVSFCQAEANPFSLKGVHIINLPDSVFTKAFEITKKLMKAKIVDRIMVHKNLESLYNFAPREILPNEYGGKIGNVNTLNSDFYEYLISRRDVILKEAAKKTDESKRPVKCPYSEEIFGFEGSFRSLNVD